MEHIVYQQRPGGTPVMVSNHRTEADAINAASNLMQQWDDSGVNPPSIFVCYNGIHSTEVWRDGAVNETFNPA